MSTLQTVQNMMAEQFDLKPEDLTPDAPLDKLGLDSLSMIEFMFNVEDAFHVKMPDERMDIRTIRDIANIVERLMAQQKPVQ